MNDLISKQAAIKTMWDALYDYEGEYDERSRYGVLCDAEEKLMALLPAQPEKRYTKADYIMALHKEYGCNFAKAEKAHDKALEYLRNTTFIKG